MSKTIAVLGKLRQSFSLRQEGLKVHDWLGAILTSTFEKHSELSTIGLKKSGPLICDSFLTFLINRYSNNYEVELVRK